MVKLEKKHKSNKLKNETTRNRGMFKPNNETRVTTCLFRLVVTGKKLAGQTV